MELVSINISGVRAVHWRGHIIETGIFKAPVGAGPVEVHELGLAGDRQADPRVHGGVLKAVYVYPVEHYDYWRERLGAIELPPGSFGENLTTKGILESDARRGDLLRIGTATFRVTQPRVPCFKLAMKFDRPGIIREFLESGRSGFYLRVVQSGHVNCPSPIEHVRADVSQPSMAELARRT